MPQKITGYVNPDGSGKGNWSQVERRVQRLPYSWRQAVRNDDPLSGLNGIRIIAELLASIIILTILMYVLPFVLWLFLT